jgi:hypothetical protein
MDYHHKFFREKEREFFLSASSSIRRSNHGLLSPFNRIINPSPINRTPPILQIFPFPIKRTSIIWNICMFPTVYPQQGYEKVFVSSIFPCSGPGPALATKSTVDIEIGIGVCGLAGAKFKRTAGIEGRKDTESAHGACDHPDPA